MFVLISKLYRQMYANTGIATDSARVARSARRARVLAQVGAQVVRRRADARSRDAAAAPRCRAASGRRESEFAGSTDQGSSGRAGGRRQRRGHEDSCSHVHSALSRLRRSLSHGNATSRRPARARTPRRPSPRQHVGKPHQPRRDATHARALPRRHRVVHSLVSYRAVRRLSVVARGGKMTASLTAWTSLDPVNGFDYDVLDESGSGMLRSRVLHGALEAEREAKRRAEGRPWRAVRRPTTTFEAGELTSDGLAARRDPSEAQGLAADGRQHPADR